MKAVVYTEYGPPDVLYLREVATPAPKANEVLIKVHATTVTTGDCNARGFVFVPAGFKPLARLMFGLRKPKKAILGVEFAGEIEAVGNAVKRFKAGDQVFGIDGMRLGAYAEYKRMTEERGMAIKPANLTYAEAAAIPNGALTALTFLRNMGNIRNGQKVLINGASGSVGSAAVQLARYFGAEVTGVCSTANRELVKSLGADKVIDYTQEDFTQSGETYDIIFDTVGKAAFSRCKNALKPKGLYLAGAGGLREFGHMLRTSIMGSQKVKAGVSSERKDDLLFIKDLVEAGKFKPVIDRIYPLEQIVEAHRYVDTGRKKGNVVIIIGHNHKV
jgi:NADPH:quinone reductase-like Zn-dependent oxidoreductase